MPDYVLRPEAIYTSNSEDMTGAVFALGLSDPGTANGLANGTTYIAQEILLSPASTAFTPMATAPGQMGAPGLSASNQTITVTLASDPADNGAPITRYDIRHSSDETNWTTTTDITSPHDITALAASTSYFVQSRAGNSVGLGNWSPSTQATTGALTGTLTFTEDANGEAELASAGAGSITITTPTVYAGTDAVDLDALSGAPHNLAAPDIIDDASPAAGETLSLTPGLWLYDTAHPAPALSYQWRRDGVTIAGATATTYVLQAADAGTTITVAETATQNSAGSATAVSAGISVAASGGGDTTTFTHNETHDPGSSFTGHTFSNVPIGAAASDRTVFVFGFKSGGVADPTGVTIGGITASMNASSLASLPEINFQNLSLWHATIPTGSSVDIDVSGQFDAFGIVVYVAYGKTPSTPVVSGTTTVMSIDLAINTSNGDDVIAVAAGGNIVSPIDWTGLSKDIQFDTKSNELMSGAAATSVAQATPLPITASHATTSREFMGISVALS